MSQAPFRVAPLDKTHERSAFKSGSEPLDHYFHQQVSQDIRRRVTACFVALDVAQSQRIAGFYTLASSSVLLADLPPETGKKLPRYPSVPAVRMGRLAVDEHFKGQGLGGALLADALARAARADIASFCAGRRCQGRGGRQVLPSPRVYRLARLAADLVLAAGDSQNYQFA